MSNFLQVAGPSGQMTWIRGGPECLDAKNIEKAIDNRFSLLAFTFFLCFLLFFLDGGQC